MTGLETKLLMTIVELYTEYEAALQRYAMRLTRDRDRADDLVQETFIRAMGHLALLQMLKSYQCRAWLYRTLKNLFLDEQKARRRQEALVEQMGKLASVHERSFDDLVVPNPFDLVPDSYREIFEKRYVWGQSSEEIAEELGIPAATVRSRLHLAMKKLRSQKSQWQ